MYQVVKKIKGHSYLYNQETFRDNSGTVKTISHYIGPVNIVGGMSRSRSSIKDEVINISQNVDTVIQKLVQEKTEPESVLVQSPKVQSRSRSIPRSKYELTLQNHLVIDTDLGKYQIGRTSLEMKQNDFLRQSQAAGLDVSKFPKITIKSGGSTVKSKKTFDGDYKIYLPRKPHDGVRANFDRCYQRVIADIYLKTIEQQKPELYQSMQVNLKKAYHNQNKAIVSYINQSKRKSDLKLGLTLHFLYSKMVSAWTQLKLAPQKLGFVDYSQRRNWREDTVLLMAEVQKEGWSKCYLKYVAELQKTEQQVGYQIKQYKKMGFMDKLNGKARAKRQDIRRLNARRRAVFATCDKLSYLSNIYSTRADEPFLHLMKWEDKKIWWKKLGHDLDSI